MKSNVEQQQCEYCHAKPIIDVLYQGAFLAFDEDGVVAFGNDGSVTTSEHYARINYCPMCGRKLVR
ncbi:MAG: hypothetical protein ABF991_00485 [Liquorilactobacillus hordei]